MRRETLELGALCALAAAGLVALTVGGEARSTPLLVTGAVMVGAALAALLLQSARPR